MRTLNEIAMVFAKRHQLCDASGNRLGTRPDVPASDVEEALTDEQYVSQLDLWRRLLRRRLQIAKAAKRRGDK